MVMARLGVFTVEDLAARSGVPEATVRTVIRRNPTLVREVGIKRTGRRGGQRIRYQVDPEHEVELRDTLENIRSGLLPADDTEISPLPASLAADPLWLPLSVSAAEAVLIDELPSASVDKHPALLRAADEYIQHARQVRDSADDTESTVPYLVAHLDLLDFIRTLADAETREFPGRPLAYDALMAQWRYLPWGVLEPGAYEKVLARAYGLVEEPATQEVAAMPIDVVYSDRHGIPSRLNQALNLVRALYSKVHVAGIPVGWPDAADHIHGSTAQPRLCVLAFDRASIEDQDPALIIPAVAQKMGPIDGLIVAAEKMHAHMYRQAVTHGATFIYLDAGDAAYYALRQEINRASERFIAEALRSGLEGRTPFVAQGSGLQPLGHNIVSPMLAPDISPIARRAQRIFETLEARERLSFNLLTDERQLGTLRALVGLQAAIEGQAFDAPMQERIESAILAFARESTKSHDRPDLTGAVIEVASVVEILAKTFLSRLAYSVCGKDTGRIMVELKLPTSRIRMLSLGIVVQALRTAGRSETFASVHHKVPEEWMNRLDAFAGERNAWAHGVVQGTDTQLIDQAFLAIREGIAIAGWLAVELQSIRDHEQARERGDPVNVPADIPGITLTPRVPGSELRVFISHASTDSQIAERLGMRLQAMGYNSWYAEWELTPGDSIVTKIQDSMAACDVLIVALSPNSVKSRWINRELNSSLMAQLGGQQVLVIPALIETCDIPALLSDTRYINLREDFEEGFVRILDAIRSHRRRTAQ
jgi:hypothetical protein